MLNHQKSNLLPKTRSQASEEEIQQHADLLFRQIEGQLILADAKAYLTILTNAILLVLLTLLEAQKLHVALHLATPLPQRLSSLCILLVFLTLLCSSFYALRALLPTLQPVREMKESFLSEVYAKARIARRKLSFGTRSISFFFFALLFWLLAQFLLLYT